ncbi:MAG: sigma factor [Caldimonas sp.]
MNEIEENLRALLLLALNGNDIAYVGFLTQSSVHLRACFRRRLAAFPDDVEDLVQETLLALHNQRHTYRPSERLTPWLYGECANPGVISGVSSRSSLPRCRLSNRGRRHVPTLKLRTS